MALITRDKKGSNRQIMPGEELEESFKPTTSFTLSSIRHSVTEVIHTGREPLVVQPNLQAARLKPVSVFTTSRDEPRASHDNFPPWNTLPEIRESESSAAVGLSRHSIVALQKGISGKVLLGVHSRFMSAFLNIANLLSSTRLIKSSFTFAAYL